LRTLTFVTPISFRVEPALTRDFPKLPDTLPVVLNAGLILLMFVDDI